METTEEINQKREKISKYTREMLEEMKTASLKKLASGIVPGYTKMKSPEIIENLMAATRAERTLIALIPDTPIEAIEQNTLAVMAVEEINGELSFWTNNLYQEFRNVIQANWKDGNWDERIHSDIAALAYRVVRFLDMQSGNQDDGGTAFTTKMRNRTRICNLITELVESESGSVYYKQLESCLEMLKKQIGFQFKDTSKLKKGLQERRLAERKTEKETISFAPIYEFATNVLSNLGTMKDSDWKKVSIALAIVSGRRMAEIHTDSTRFEYVDKTTCKFTGQLKVKGDAGEYFKRNPGYEIPVLINAQLVVAAHQWMIDKKKVVENAQKASTRYSKDLSDAMKTLKKRFSIDHGFFTYKGLRTIYAQVCSQVFNDNDPDNTLYLAKILGHGRGELVDQKGELVVGRNITDMLTPQSYNSDFRVVDVPRLV